LIKRGADPGRKDKFGRTPFHYAASYAKDINIIDVLVNNKQVDVNALDYSGLRALSYAKCNQHGLTSDIVQRLNVPLHTAVAAHSRRPLILFVVVILCLCSFDSVYQFSTWCFPCFLIVFIFKPKFIRYLTRKLHIY
jgi:ankyrin repeat protein